MTDRAAMADRMRVLRARFVERAREDRARLAEAWAAGDREALVRLCHSLAGNAGLFGFEALGMAARRLEDALGEDIADEAGAIAADLFDRLDGLA